MFWKCNYLELLQVSCDDLRVIVSAQLSEKRQWNSQSFDRIFSTIVFDAKPVYKENQTTERQQVAVFFEVWVLLKCRY